jgi:glycerol-3-phosphate O-acyltransferase
VAACAFERLHEGVGGDIFALLRSHDDVTVSRAELAQRVERLRDRARELESHQRIVLGARLGRATGREILDDALRAFSGYHTTPVLEPRGEDLVLRDTRLIFYYQNRLAAHGLALDLTPGAPGGLGALGPRAAPRLIAGASVPP